jgi:pSer/pThr/pTyr-binding forkhead associated (FHA) protein
VATATAERTATVAATEMIAPGGFARLAYVDEQGPHLFVMRKELVSIGRGGSAHWVDVQVASTPRVSREHCRIRRDSQGRFFLQDISTWGTSVNGEAIPPFLRQAGERVEETGQERELPRQARIQLADAIVIEFEAQVR